MTIDNKTIEKILNGDDLTKIENEIARLTGHQVIRDHLSYTIDLLKRDIANSRLGLDIIVGIIKYENDKLLKFGVELLSDKKVKDTQHEEEYPKGEQLNKRELSKVINTQGLGVGFGIQYAIYYYFLKNKQSNELNDYLKISRIPFAKRFSRQLNDIYLRIDKNK